VAKFHFLFSLILPFLGIASLAMPNQSALAQEKKLMAADLLIVNAIVHTMDPAQPMAEAVAILGNRIAAVGSTDEIRSLAGPKTRIIDAGKRLVLPGFNDAHVHFLSGGFQLSYVDLRDAKSPGEFAERIHRFAEKIPKGQWIVGGEWDHERWPGPPLPTKELVDAATTNNPVFVSRLDGHMALANSLALKMAGVTRETAEVDAGKIVRDPKTDEPTGVLKDAAMALVEKIIPDNTFEEKLAAARAATDYAASLGVTSVQDMSTGADVAVYQTLLDRGELKTRIYGMTPLSRWERLGNAGIRAHFGNDMLRIGGLKAFSDGSLGSSTALFFEPYLDEPTCGLPGPDMFPPGLFLKRALMADQAGLQLVVHAIGDRANDEVLNVFKTVAEQNGARDRRSRIEHAQHLRANDIPRFGAEHVIASMQPYHCIDDGRWCEARIGAERCKGTYAFRSLLNSGATLAFGSDWTVAPLDPMTGVYAAVTRRTLDDKNPDGWYPEQKLTVEETIHAYTVGSAYAEFTETVKGTLTPGKLADVVMLDQDIFKINPVEIMNTHVLLTVMDGRVVYERSAH
jgi:predicted amidohydrolase YtcJ